MSYRLVRWAIDECTVRGSARAVMIAIADKVNEEAGYAWPSIRCLAQMTGLSERTVQYGIRALAAAGEIKVETQSSEHGSNHYWILKGATAAPVQDEHPSSSCTPPQQLLHPTPAAPAPELVLKENEPLVPRDRVLEDFEAWWKLYPRKADRQSALKRYRARRKAGVPVASLLAAVGNYARARQGQDPTFTKHGGTFLNGDDGPWSEWITHAPDRQSTPAFFSSGGY